MLRRPLSLWLIGIGLILSPLYYYFERAVVGHVPWTDPGLVLGGMSKLKLAAAVLGPVVGVLVLQVRKVSWYAILGYALYTMAANVLLYAQGQVRASLLAVFLPTGLACILYFARREIVSPFFNPRLRGWVSDRVRFSAPAEIDIDGEVEEAELWDISSTGLYLATSREVAAGQRLGLALSLVEGEEPVRVSARAVWCSRGLGDRPAGIGAEFEREAQPAVAAALKKVLRRTQPRLPFKLRVDIAVEHTTDCETFDVSATGCFLVTDLPIPVGSQVKLKLHLEEPVVVRGEVVRTWEGSADQPQGIGVRFGSTPGRLRAALREFHARRAES